MTAAPLICWQARKIDRCVVLEPDLTLDAKTYRQFSDGLVKFVIGQPRAVIVCLDHMTVASDAVLTAFTSARLRTSKWPSVPILLVARSVEVRRRLERSAIRRLLTVHSTVAAAIAASGEPPIRRWTTRTMALSPFTGHMARRLIDEVCAEWGIGEVSEAAQIIATEFIDNADLHGHFTSVPDIDVRLEYRENLLTVAVADPDPREAVLREPDPGSSGRRLHGLHIVAEMASAWGCVPRWPTGKVVWATLSTRRPQDP
ncbi:STAS domain-containing protein [Nocardia aobensis]|uniref:STAS domain-containing protein n=1 Tax=Nocardia aobensis TaxID=257277 RepID=UPI0006851C20|nr:STAS domain-containing protein [Nocardia aobensis]